MPEKSKGIVQDMHSEAWWIHLMEDALSPKEQAAWEEHLQQCAQCRSEWAALASVDEFLRGAPEPPPLPRDFTAVTVQRIAQKQRLRRLLSFIAGTLIVAAVAVLVFAAMGTVFASLERGIGAVVAARQILFQSLVHTLVGLILTWKAVLPFAVGLTVIVYMLIMPNGMLVTAAFVWLHRRRRTTA
jgi:predicted anti-sigma-YlaC factor YlaD